MLPLQRPLVEHIATPRSRQTARGSGVPAGTLVQRPRAVGSPQVTQVPTQVLLQQKPSTQKPDAQSFAVVHAWPLGRLPQLPLVQMLGATQSALLVQVARHALVPHWKGAHGMGIAS